MYTYGEYMGKGREGGKLILEEREQGVGPNGSRDESGPVDRDVRKSGKEGHERDFEWRDPGVGRKAGRSEQGSGKHGPGGRWR